MDRYAKTKKGMNIKQKTRVKVAGLINDLHLLQSLPGATNDVAKSYNLGKQFLKYFKELDLIKIDKLNKTVLYSNPKNHSAEYIIDYVMSRYEYEYSKKNTPSDLVTCQVELPAHMKGIAQDAIYKNEIKNLQSELNRQEAQIRILRDIIEKKNDALPTKKKSIFAKIKTLFT